MNLFGFFIPEKLVDIKTYIPERGVWVSTVAFDTEIGYGRCAETMVFKGDEKGITDYAELYFESHGYCTNEETLRKEHERIVEGIRKEEIRLEEEREERSVRRNEEE